MANKKVAETIYLIDAGVFGISDFTSAYLLAGEELALIETGPAKSAPAVLEGIRGFGFDPQDISYLIITHIHLDHGGGAGTLINEMPKAKVVVHERGAKHMMDPSILVNSSKRVFGDLIDKWYGEVLPIGKDRILPVKDGDEVDLGRGQSLRMIDSPGHANHHICIYSEKEKGLFTGDAAGVYIPNLDTVIPTTPPPEFDPDVNINTMKGFMALDLQLLLFSHFGPALNVNKTLNTSMDWLLKWKDTASELMNGDSPLEEITKKFKDDARDALGSDSDSGQAFQWVMDHHIPMCAFGYFNYFSKKAL
ncbi:MAG: MBL fold metallo-hydrolase [Thermodesulfobacteriota bacterium]|nr:MBL fold metallo-hydrolase [Thermodesulfobacteriota bacterium]